MEHGLGFKPVGHGEGDRPRGAWRGFEPLWSVLVAVGGAATHNHLVRKQLDALRHVSTRGSNTRVSTER